MGVVTDPGARRVLVFVPDDGGRTRLAFAIAIYAWRCVHVLSSMPDDTVIRGETARSSLLFS